MPGSFLTTGSTIQCTHGGTVLLITSDVSGSAGTGRILLETDVHPVVGCPFTVGPKYSPCVRVEWKAGATMASIGGVPPLIQTSIGTCFNAESAPQGVAIVVSADPKGSAS